MPVTLTDGRTLELRRPMMGDLRGIKLVDLLSADPAPYGVLLERISDLTAAEFYALSVSDGAAVMGAVADFFAEAGTSPPASKTPGP